MSFSLQVRVNIPALHIRQLSLQCAQRWREEVLSASGNHKSVDSRQVQFTVCVLWEKSLHGYIRLVIRLSHYRVDSSSTKAKSIVVRPQSLNEFEALTKIALVACKEQAALSVGVLADLWAVRNAAA